MFVRQTAKYSLHEKIKEEKMKEVQEKTHNQMIYLMAVDILRRWGNSGKVLWDVLERINQKNAEKMQCAAVALR